MNKTGIIPPQALELEDAVLGALLLGDRDAVESVINDLKPEVFYKNENQIIFKAILKLFKQQKAIDLLTVSNELRNSGEIEKIGGDFEIIRLTQSIKTTAHIEHHTKVLVEKYLLRNLIQVSNEVSKMAFSQEDVFEIFDYFDKNIELNKFTGSSVKTRDFQDIILETTNKLKQVYEGNDSALGIPINLKELKRIIGGWKNTFSYIVAARPGMGKNIVANQIIVDNAQNGIKTGVISLEMSDTNIGLRIVTAVTDVPNQYFERKKADDEVFKTYFEKIINVEKLAEFICIDDDPFVTPQSLSNKISIMVKKLGCKMVIIDYLQLVSSDSKGTNREQQINEISRTIKLNAKKHNIPILTLCQLSRAVETRGGYKRPMLSDLRESGAIEQDADVVMFLYRPDYYGIETWDDANNTPCANQMEIMVAKHRGGGLDNARVGVDVKRSKVFNIEKESFDCPY